MGAKPAIRPLAPGMLLLFAASCQQDVDDVGSICVHPQDIEIPYPPYPDDPPREPVMFEAGAPLHATGVISHYVGWDISETRCSIERDGDNIQLHMHYRTPSKDPPDLQSTLIYVECSLPSLPAGSYTLRFHDSEQTLEVPSLAPPPCISSSWGPL